MNSSLSTDLISVLLDNSIILVPKSIESNEEKKNTGWAQK